MEDSVFNRQEPGTEYLRVYQCKPEASLHIWNYVSDIIMVDLITREINRKRFMFENGQKTDDRDFYGYLLSRRCYDLAFIPVLIVIHHDPKELSKKTLNRADVANMIGRCDLLVFSNYSEQCRIYEQDIMSFFVTRGLPIRKVMMRGKAA